MDEKSKTETLMHLNGASATHRTRRGALLQAMHAMHMHRKRKVLTFDFSKFLLKFE